MPAKASSDAGLLHRRPKTAMDHTFTHRSLGRLFVVLPSTGIGSEQLESRALGWNLAFAFALTTPHQAPQTTRSGWPLLRQSWQALRHSTKLGLSFRAADSGPLLTRGARPTETRKPLWRCSRVWYPRPELRGKQPHKGLSSRVPAVSVFILLQGSSDFKPSTPAEKTASIFTT